MDTASNVRFVTGYSFQRAIRDRDTAFRYSFQRAIRDRDVLVVQCISTLWPNSELQWSVRLGKSWLTTAHHLFVTSLVGSYGVTTHPNVCNKHFGNTLHNRKFGRT